MTDIVQASTEGHEGVLVFYAATFSNTPDAVGDIVDPHAFDNWYKSFSNRPGAVLPVVFSHNWANAHDVIGYARANDIQIDSHGLQITGHLDLDNETAVQVLRQAKTGSIAEASFSYDVVHEHRQGKVNVLDELVPLEVGPCLIGANRETSILSASTVKAHVKSAFAAVDNILRGRIELAVKHANMADMELPPFIRQKAKEFGIATSPEADLADALSESCRCPNGHLLAKPTVKLPGTAPSSWCAIDGDFVIFAPKSVTTAQIIAQGTRLKAWHAAKVHDMRMRQAEAAGTLSAWEADGRIPKAADLTALKRRIDSTVTEVKSQADRDIEDLQRVLRKGMNVWGPR